MAIQNDAELAATVKTVSEGLQSIQDFVGRDYKKPCKVNFPCGYIRSAEDFRKRFWFVVDRTLQQNLAYAFILHDLQHWLLVRTTLKGTAREMLIKDAVVLLGNIAETITKLPDGVRKKNNYKKRTEALESASIISRSLRIDLDWLWDTRQNCHLFLVAQREYGHYGNGDYERAVRTLRAFRDALDAYFVAEDAKCSF